MDYTPTKIASLRRQRSVSTQKLSQDVVSPGSGSSQDSSYFVLREANRVTRRDAVERTHSNSETSDGARRLLFEELSSDAVPGNLHLAPESVIQNFVQKHGTVETVRQLASDLAEREAQLSLLRRQHDDRERELRKMLIESGVAVHQIDKRLLNIPTTALRRPDEVIGEELAEAIETQFVVSDTERRRTALRERLSEIRDSDQASVGSIGNASQSSKNNDLGSSMVSEGGRSLEQAGPPPAEGSHTQTTITATTDTARKSKETANGAAAALSLRGELPPPPQHPSASVSVVTSPSSELDRAPLELATFVPAHSQPPPLRYGAGDLTDRYGFIYDTSRKVSPKPQQPDETPAPNDASETRSLDSINIEFNVNNAPSVTTVSATTNNGHGGRNEHESVKLLLKHLSNVHDEMQKVQTSKWDEFLAKLPDDTVIERGELFGVSGTGLASAGEKSLVKEFKALVYSGIPVKYRPRIWGECSGAWVLKEPGTYESLLSQPNQNTEAINQIDLDLHRTMPHNVYFRDNGPGLQRLRRVLVAFGNRNWDVGYCQGMNMIAAVLLLTYPTEEDAFWSLVSLIENLLPDKYFCAPLDGPRVDQAVLRYYLCQRLPQLYGHLVDDLNVHIEMITFDWFLSCFTDALPLEVLLRVWDVFLCVEGHVYLFQVAIALFKIYEKDLKSLKSAAEVYSFMKNLANKPLGVDTLIRTAKMYALDPLHVKQKRESLATAHT